jgi:hypothetical protein
MIATAPPFLVNPTVTLACEVVALVEGLVVNRGLSSLRGWCMEVQYLRTLVPLDSIRRRRRSDDDDKTMSMWKYVEIRRPIRYSSAVLSYSRARISLVARR